MPTQNPRIVCTINYANRFITIGTTLKVSESKIENFYFPVRRDELQYAAHNIGLIGATIIAKVNDVAGCIFASIEPYSLDIQVGIAFAQDQGDIANAIIEIIKDAFGDQRNSIEMKIISVEVKIISPEIPLNTP